ncbi:MAG: ribonuclease HI [Chitinophagaceae bacterium]|nr:ribonuclease HI [Chitinophagaceae bacterium]
MKKIIIYTDGSSRGNPGAGGFGALLMFENHKKEIAQGYRFTTNNRMELLAVIVALQQLKTKDIPVEIYTDSQYVVYSVEKKWLNSWLKNNFKGGKKNKDLWLKYAELAKQFSIKFHWVKGHANNPYNNRCDELATAAADNKKNLLIDEVYEKGEA